MAFNLAFKGLRFQKRLHSMIETTSVYTCIFYLTICCLHV